VTPALHSLCDGGWLAPNALIVVETAEEEDNIAATPGFIRIDARVYGETRVTFLRSEVLVL